MTAEAPEVRLIVQQCHTECGACRYGRGGWAGSPALKGKPILTPESRECPGCGARFTHIENVYAWSVEPIADAVATSTNEGRER